MRREHHRVEVDFLEVVRGRLRQPGLTVRACAPGVIDAARIGAEIAAAVHGKNLQVRMALEHAVEDEVVQRQRGLERVADDVVEIEAREALALREAVRMQQHERAELLRLLPERRKGRIGQFAARHVGQNLHALELERLDAALELLGGFRTVRHRHGAERDEAVRPSRHIFRDTIVDHARRLHGDIERHRVVALRRRAHHELEVDAHGVEIGEPLVMADHARTPVGVLAHADRLGFGRREMRQRNGREIEMRLHELGCFGDRDMGMQVDGHAFGPRRAAGLPGRSRGRRAVAVPVVCHDGTPLRRCFAQAGVPAHSRRSWFCTAGEA